MKSIQFILGIHNHQPVGNFDYVFEDAYQKSYKPFVDILDQHPAVSMVLHFSGCLLEWLENHHPNFLDEISHLVERGNIELLTGGFYEPILPVIPDHDKLGQIRKMNDFLKSRFNYEPTGIWLAERVWESHLARFIHEAGIEYTVVDDSHFLAGGKQLKDLNGYFVTEEQGFPLGIFPIRQRLRYTMPFDEPEETLEFLHSQATEDGENVIVMADDGEKFGVWPGSHERCFGKDNWLQRFLNGLQNNSDWLVTTTFRDYYRSHPPKGRVYLPDTSYFEMNEWTLPSERGEQYSRLLNEFGKEGKFDEVRPFLRGGTWRNFLAIYDESNWMHRRMLDISFRLERAPLPEKKLKKARHELWRSQCNCAYWHGVFGGLYLPHLRHAVFEHLLSAESELDSNPGKDNNPRDIDGNGASEFKLCSDKLKIIASARGGMIQEFDYLPRNFNLLNTMKRYSESYHSRVKEAPVGSVLAGSIHGDLPAKASGLSRLLNYDPWPRKMLQDHFIEGRTRLSTVRKRFDEKGDFLGGIYTSQWDGTLDFHRKGRAFDRNVFLQKRMSLKESQLSVEISVTNESNRRLPGIYGCELNFAMLGGHTPDRYYEVDGKKAKPGFLDSSSEDLHIRSIGIVNRYDGFRVAVRFAEPVNVWRFPVETVSMSESGFEKIYQSSVVMPYWRLGLAPGQSISTRFTIEVKDIK